jgi:hypothetical protein
LSNVIHISTLVLFTLVSGFCGFSFWWINKYWKIVMPIPRQIDKCPSYPLIFLEYLYHWSSSLHKLLYIICA